VPAGSPTQKRDKQAIAWLAANAPGFVHETLSTRPGLEAVAQASHRKRLQDEALDLPPVAPLTKLMKVAVAIRNADLRHRRKHGTRLEDIKDYDALRMKGDPSRTMIYSEYGSWDHAKLAALDPAHFHFAFQRKQGGTRKDPEFSEEQRTRALLGYAEQHAGCLPGRNEYERWQTHRPDLPTVGQVICRRDGQNGVTWNKPQEAALSMALASSGWPLTRERHLLDQLARNPTQGSKQQ